MAQGFVRFALLEVDFINGRPGPEGLDNGVAAFDDPVGLGSGGSALFHKDSFPAGDPA